MGPPLTRRASDARSQTTRWLQAQQDGTGCVSLAAFKEGLAQQGVLVADADCRAIAAGIDPAGAGARVQVARILQELQA